MLKKINLELDETYYSRYNILKFYIDKYIDDLYYAIYNNDIDYINKIKFCYNQYINQLNNRINIFHEDITTQEKYEILKYNVNLFFETYDFNFLIKKID